MKGADYHGAIEKWLGRHKPGLVLCFVQFTGVKLDELPRLYLATPREVADRLRATANGRGDTILYEYHELGPRAKAAGTVERIPDGWRFTRERIDVFLPDA